ncbi:MAG: hypothetical protein JO118_10150 [Acetobacteraceae bacterium]|nr:hypothetical protein [Acetobacteraceae bacterium]
MELVAEPEPGVAIETELARIERDPQAGLADLGLRLEEAKRLTAALQAELVPARVAEAGGRRREACGRVLASKGRYRARFRFLFGGVPIRVRRRLACPCREDKGGLRSFAALDLGGDASHPSWPT